MPQNGISLGPDYQFGLYDGFTKQILAVGDVQNVKVTYHNSSINSKPYNGPPRFAHVPDGVSGSFSIVRTSQVLEVNEIARAAAINSGGTVLPSSFLNKTVTNPDGSVTKSQFTNLDWYVTEAADVSRDKAVTQSIEWHASQEVIVS